MIIHILSPKRYHLTPSIASNFLELEGNHKFQYVLYCEKKFDKDLYTKLFDSDNFSNYVFCQSKWKLFKYMHKHNDSSVLCHSDDFLYFSILLFLARCKSISWVCWGAGTTIQRGFKGILFGLYSKFAYKKLKYIITLMSGDRDSLIRNYNIDGTKIYTIPYGFKSLPFDTVTLYRELRARKSPSKKIAVVLGNNPTNIEDYITMLETLKPYRGRITIDCMLNYSLNRNERYVKLLMTGRDLFGDDFSTDEVLRSKDDYIKKMSEYDVYICSAKRQTGLGAIYTMLRLGKKIYIKGKNYEWIKNEYNSIIFNVDIINSSLPFEDFASPLSIEEQEYNLESNLAKFDENKKKWINILSNIDN